MNHDEMTANIHAVWMGATVAEVDEGRAWYGQAYAIALDLARDGAPWVDDITRAAYVIAALSPRQAWARNVALARQAYAIVRGSETCQDARDAILAGLPTLGLQRRQVAALLADGADPDTVVKGTKTNAFARTIADPADPDLVVIDRHAMAIAYGRAMGADLSLTDKRYRAIADAYREVAETVGELPSTVQAVTWVAWRRSDSAHSQARAAARMTP